MAKPSKQLITQEMRALVRHPGVVTISVRYRYDGVVGADGLTRYTFLLAGSDASDAEVTRLTIADQTYKLSPALDSELTRAGFVREGEAASGGMSGETVYRRAQSQT